MENCTFTKRTLNQRSNNLFIQHAHACTIVCFGHNVPREIVVVHGEALRDALAPVLRWVSTVHFLNIRTPKQFVVIALKLHYVAPLGAVWSGSALFAQAYLSENLGSLRYLMACENSPMVHLCEWWITNRSLTVFEYFLTVFIRLYIHCILVCSCKFYIYYTTKF